MLYGASVFNGNISSWDTSVVTDMYTMFASASSFNQEGVSNWDTSAATDMMYGMLYYVTSFNQNLCAWKDTLPYNNAIEIFGGSGCTFKDNPIEQQGPFCAFSCSWRLQRSIRVNENKVLLKGRLMFNESKEVK